MVCGTPFVSLTGRGTCSPKCEHAARISHGAPRKPDTRANLSQAAWRRGRVDAELIRSLSPAVLDQLAEADQRVISLYYGLVDGGPQTQAEIAAYLGKTRSFVEYAVYRSVTRLFPDAPKRSTRGRH